MLLNRHGDALLRVKSILNVADAATPVAVQPAGYLMPASFFFYGGPMVRIRLPPAVSQVRT